MRLPSVMLCLALAGCSKDKPADPPSKPADPPATSAPKPVAPAPPVAPKAAAPAPLKSPPQGQLTWAVFVYAGPPGAKVDAAKQLLTDKGLEAGVQFSEGELVCSDGAPEALKLPGESIAVSVHFATEADAKAFAATLAAPPVGIAQVKQGCAD